MVSKVRKTSIVINMKTFCSVLKIECGVDSVCYIVCPSLRNNVRKRGPKPCLMRTSTAALKDEINSEACPDLDQQNCRTICAARGYKESLQDLRDRVAEGAPAAELEHHHPRMAKRLHLRKSFILGPLTVSSLDSAADLSANVLGSPRNCPGRQCVL
ncbi:uncharacterized protein LOC119659923 isoform X2 [Hermetia illucens]|uniref:uncharacterized protein LOC119659923 isoform X2 n=1 Tax=Hermetia illucens TaxID=343691 RepID=UPI0018CC4132|nr:uncharacterized protein LOC119659923 isoform X2 [Hermetia illucens]